MISTVNYFNVKTCEEAIQLAHDHADDFCWIAGGTDVMLNRQQENNTAACLIDIGDIGELRGIAVHDNKMRIGSLTTLHDVGKNELILQGFPTLAQAAKSVASPLVRYSATIGGNLLVENRCISYNQSEFWKEAVNHCMKIGGEKCLVTGSLKHCFSQFVSDTAPVLLCLNAEVQILDKNGSRILPLQEMYSGVGLSPRRLDKQALLTDIFIPMSKPHKIYFRKLTRRKAVDFTSLTCAISADEAKNITLALSGVHPGPVMLQDMLDCDAETLVKRALKASKTVDNDMYSRTYRRKMIGVFIREGLQMLKKLP